MGVWDTGGLSSSLRLMADPVYIRYYIIVISSVLYVYGCGVTRLLYFVGWVSLTSYKQS